MRYGLKDEYGKTTKVYKRVDNMVGWNDGRVHFYMDI